MLSRFAYVEFLFFELLCVVGSIVFVSCCNSIGFPHFMEEAPVVTGFPTQATELLDSVEVPLSRVHGEIAAATW